MLPNTENNIESIESFIQIAQRAYNLICHDEYFIFQFTQKMFFCLFWAVFIEDIVPVDGYLPDVIPFTVIIESLEQHVIKLKNESN